jgi:hypothetical protein
MDIADEASVMVDLRPPIVLRTFVLTSGTFNLRYDEPIERPYVIGMQGDGGLVAVLCKQLVHILEKICASFTVLIVAKFRCHGCLCCPDD